MKKELTDKKSWLARLMLGPLNHIVVNSHFLKIEIEGSEFIPQSGPFLLVSNHISRWDGLLVQELIGRPANFMVSPNELKGPQGLVLRSMGAFPADPRYDLLSFCRTQAESGQGLVIFPEGDIYRSGSTQPFKNGAARIALTLARDGLVLPVVPMAMRYIDDNGKHRARVLIGSTIDLHAYRQEFIEQANIAIRSLTMRFHREVCCLTETLGCSGDKVWLYGGRTARTWMPKKAQIPGARSIVADLEHEPESTKGTNRTPLGTNLIFS